MVVLIMGLAVCISLLVLTKALPGESICVKLQGRRRPAIWSKQHSFLSISSDEYQNVPPINHQQKCSVNGICGTSNMKSNDGGPVISKKLSKSFEKLDQRAIKCKKRVSINRSKITLLCPNIGAAASLKSKTDALSG